MSDSNRITPDQLARLSGLTDRRLRELSAEGWFPKPVNGQCQLVPTIQGLLRYYREGERSRVRELPLAIPCCDCPERIYEYWMANIATASWYNPECECLCAIHLNTRRRATGFHLVAMGTMDCVLSSPREVFRTAMIRSAAALVLAHNHPSGESTPSEADIRVTRDLIRAGQLLKIEVLDHVIVGRPEPDRPRPFTSLREAGFFA